MGTKPSPRKVVYRRVGPEPFEVVTPATLTKEQEYRKNLAEAKAKSLEFPLVSFAVSINKGWTTRFKNGEVVFQGWEYS